MSESISDVTDDTFEADVLQASVPVLVDFWAQWCGPCRTMTTILEEIAGECAGDISILKLNVDDNQKTAVDYEVLSIPTMILFENGEAKKKMVGALSRKKILEEIDPWLGGS